jgi:kynurenine formamidase
VKGEVVPPDAAFTWGMRTIDMLSHTGAHLDAPSRLLRGGENPARVDLSDLYGPARVIDLRWHNRHTPIQITDLELKPIEEGEIVILFVGYEPRRRRVAALRAAVGAGGRISHGEEDPRPGDRPPGDRALRRHREPHDPGAAAGRGVGRVPAALPGRHPIIAGLVNLDAIVKEPKIAFVGFPIALPIADGAPVRAAALVY